jgi:hypothetical protein
MDISNKITVLQSPCLLVATLSTTTTLSIVNTSYQISGTTVEISGNP